MNYRIQGRDRALQVAHDEGHRVARSDDARLQSSWKRLRKSLLPNKTSVQASTQAPPAGFEPAFPNRKVRCPRPLDEGGETLTQGEESVDSRRFGQVEILAEQPSQPNFARAGCKHAFVSYRNEPGVPSIRGLR